MTDELMELPEGWEWTTAIEACSKVVDCHNKTAPYTTSGIKLVRTSNIRNGSINLNDTKFVDQPTYEYWSRRCPPEPGDILFTREAPMAEVGMIPDGEKLCMGQRMMLLRVDNDNLLGKFLLYALQAPFIHDYADSVAVGTGVKHLRVKDVEQIPIPLPPLNEQKRIVAQIEALRERSQKAKAALEAIPELCDRFRQSVLAAAFRGDLTADWREQNPDVEPAEVLLERTAKESKQNLDEVIREIDRDRNSLPNSWTWAKFKLFTKEIKAGKNFSCPEVPVTKGTVGLVKISAVTWGEFDPKETKTVEDVSKVDSSLFICAGDFLISRANTIELVGASVVVNKIDYRIMLSDKVWRVTFLEVDKKFINLYLKSNYGRKEIESRATGNQLSMRNISQNAFKDIPVALPPLSEQQEIVEQIETLFETIEQIEQQQQFTKTQLDRLNQSILAKAFRGELVEQDPNDEPAAVLLERIRAEREAQQPAQKKRHGSKRKTESEQINLPLE
jgi:type I restriction enzyme S subunit